MKVTFLGDIMLNAEQLALHKNGNSFEFSETFNAIQENFSDSNLIIANLETPISGDRLKYTHELYSFNSPIEFAKSVKDNGIGLVTTANNHCLDRGVVGLEETIKNLDKIGLEHIGTHLNQEEPSFIIKEFGGIKIGFVAFTYGTNAFANGIYLKRNERFMVDMFQNQELHGYLTKILYRSNNFFVKTARLVSKKFGLFQFDRPVYERSEYSGWHIRRYKNALSDCKRAGADYVVSLLHVGGQYNDAPTKLTKRICKNSIKWGADVVIANHEHVIHGFDKSMFQNGNFCFYSLGNCLSSTGVTEKPLDKLSEYSAAIIADFTVNKKIEFCLIFLTSVLLPNGKIVIRSLYDEIAKCTDSEKKKTLIAHNNQLCNKVFSTTNIEYPVQREYNIA